MSETRAPYYATMSNALLKDGAKRDTLETDVDILRGTLDDLERQLLSLLVTVQRAQGKEPTVITRAERRRR